MRRSKSSMLCCHSLCMSSSTPSPARVKVSEDFWYALKDHIQSDKDTLTLDRKTGDISEQHWTILGEAPREVWVFL